MNSSRTGPVTLRLMVENWPLKKPFRITGRTWEALDILRIALEKDGSLGQGEAAGVYFRNETVTSMVDQIAPLSHMIEEGIGHDSLRHILPAGGARNALDCALWDLEAKLAGKPVWELAGFDRPKPLITSFGCGADLPMIMASVARAYTHARAIKLKLTGEPIDAERVQAVREARPDVWLGVDANQGFTRPFLEQLMPVLVQTRVSLIEQPFPVGEESLLDGLQSPIPIAADETALTASDVKSLEGRFNVVNIKLDKAGGLTEALSMARLAHELGLGTMVGNMIGTSLAMAPAYLVGQLCSVVDLDGPIFLKSDRPQPVEYTDGLIAAPESVWGGAE